MQTTPAPARITLTTQKTQGLPVEIIELPNGQTGIRLTADILYQHTPIGPVLVPRGFVSDGCSMPRRGVH